MRTRNYIIIAITLCAHLLVGAALTSAQDKDVLFVKSTGSGAILQGDIDAARKAAIADAKKNAVEQAGVQILSQTTVENFALVKDRIIMKVDAYLKSFSVIQERREGNAVVVTIQAGVGKGGLIDDATILYHDMDKPRLMVIIPEMKGDTPVPDRHIENLVSDFFLSKGFLLVDQNTARANLQQGELRKIAEGDVKRAALVGRQAGAEMIIAGTITPGEAEPVRGILYASKATLSLKAFRSDNAAIYAATSLTASAVDGIADAARRKAAEHAGQNAAKDMFWKIVKKWNDEKTMGSDIEVTVTGVSFSLLKQVVQAFKKTTGVRDVTQRSFDSPTAVLTVSFEGDATRLADSISDAGNSAFDAEIASVTPGKMSVRIKEKK
jgi:hypothetical protein